MSNAAKTSLDAEVRVAKGSVLAQVEGWAVTDEWGHERLVRPDTHRLTIDSRALSALLNSRIPEQPPFWPTATNRGKQIWVLRYVTMDREQRSGRGQYAYWWLDLQKLALPPEHRPAVAFEWLRTYVTESVASAKERLSVLHRSPMRQFADLASANTGVDYLAAVMLDRLQDGE